MQLFLRQMKTENDTVHGAKIHFGKTDYRVFIDVLDILIMEDMPNCLTDGDDIYVFMVPAKPEQ